MTTETEPEIIYSRLIDETIAAVPPLDAAAMAAARERQAILTKPPGSLGRLETLSVQLAGITGQPVPQIAGKKIIVFAGDHNVTEEGVSPYPAEVTPQMVQNFLNGGAAINALAAQAGAELTVVDAGVNANLPLHPNLTTLKPGFGTANIAQGPAMHNWQAVRCLETGIRLAGLWMADKGFNLIAAGEMGIGNTTPSAAITAAITAADVDAVTGRGAGLDDAGLAAKIAIVRQALEINQPDGANGFDVLMKVGRLRNRNDGRADPRRCRPPVHRRAGRVHQRRRGPHRLAPLPDRGGTRDCRPPLRRTRPQCGAGRHGPDAPAGPGNAPGRRHRSRPRYAHH